MNTRKARHIKKNQDRKITEYTEALQPLGVLVCKRVTEPDQTEHVILCPEGLWAKHCLELERGTPVEELGLRAYGCYYLGSRVKVVLICDQWDSYRDDVSLLSRQVFHS